MFDYIAFNIIELQPSWVVVVVVKKNKQKS